MIITHDAMDHTVQGALTPALPPPPDIGPHCTGTPEMGPHCTGTSSPSPKLFNLDLIV